jgi:cell division protein FtsA
MGNIIASLDIGDNTLKLITAEITKNKLNILNVSEVPSKGLKDGLIISPEHLTLALKDLFKKAEEVLGVGVRKVIVNIPSNDAKFISSEGLTTITNEEKIVKGVDIIRAMQASIYNRIPKNYEVANIIPMIFKINEDNPITNPINMNADTLTVKDVVAIVPKKNIYTLIKCLENIGITIIDVTLPSVGDYNEIKDEKTNREVGAVVNIGGSTTTISIFNKGVITNNEVINLGGQNIDNDISFIYKVTRVDAKRLKENLALASNRMAKASEAEIVTNKLGEKIKINQYELSEIVMSRLDEMLNLIKKQINLLTKKEISYIIFTGGMTEMADFELVLDEVFGKNAKIYVTQELGARNNKYSTAIGMIKYYNSKLELRNKNFSIFSNDEIEDLSGKHKKINISENSLLGKIFGYFFDN